MTFDFDKALEAGYNEQEIYNFLKDNNEKQNLGYDFANLEKKHKDFNAVWESIKSGDKGQLSEAEKREIERQKRADLLAKREAENKAFEAEKNAFSKELENGRFFKNMAEGFVDNFVPIELDKYAFKGLNKLGLDLKTKEQRDKFDKAFLNEAKEKLKKGDENLNLAQKVALFNRHGSDTKRNIEREKAMLKLEDKEGKFSKEEKELIEDDLGFFNTLFNDDKENIKEFKEKRKSEAIINDEIIKAMNTLKQFDEGNLFRNALFADKKEALAFKQNMLKDAYKIAELQGFDDVGMDKEGELYFIKNENGKEQKYLVNTGFFDNFWQSFFEDSKHEIGGAIIGGIAGGKRGKNAFTRGLNSIIGAAVGSAGGGFIDAKIADMKLNKEANYKANLEYALQAGLLSAAGDTALIGAYHLAKPAFKGAVSGVKGTYNYAKNHSVLGLFSTIPSQNINAANKIIDEVFTPEMKEELKAAQKEYGGGVRGEDLANPVFEKLKESFAKKYGKEDIKTQKIAKLAEIFNQNSLKTKQQEMLDLIRSDKDGSTLAYLLEVAKDDVKIQNNLKNMLNLASSNVEKNLKNLNINPREIKSILDEFEAGNKAAFKEVESQISKLYNEDIRVVLDRTHYENIKKDFLENGVNLDEMTPFLRDLENNVFAKEGVTFAKLNNFRKNLNYYIFNKDKTPNFINTLKKISETSLKAEIDKGIDNIFNELPNAYASIKELYSTSLKDYAAMKELNESIKNLKLQDSAKSADEVVDSLIKYAKGQGENGVNNLQKIKAYLGEENNAFLEMQILNRLFKESVVENDRAKVRVFDSEGFLNRVKELVGDTPVKYALNKDEAKLFLENLNGAKIPEKLNMEGFLKELESVENKENFISHLSKKEDAKSRLAYLNLVKPTLEEADLILHNGKRQDYIKKFRDEKGFYTLLITEENGKRLITFLPKTREDFIRNKIDNASLIQSFTSQASKQGNGLANESITQPLFKSKEAREFLELVEGFHKLYKNDAIIAKNFTQGTASQLSTSIATSAEGAIKQKVVRGGFDPIFRLLPDGILFGLFSKQIQGGALRYHLRKALSRSLNYDDFKLKLERELKRTNFNSNTSRLIEKFMQNLEDFNAEKEAKLARIREEEELQRAQELKRQEEIYKRQEANNLKDILEAEFKEDFGVNFEGFKGKEAVLKLLSERKGQVKGAFYKEGLGDIDLVWGEVKGSGKEAKGYGLSKIIEKHGEDFKEFGEGLEGVSKGLDEIITKGEIHTQEYGRKTIIYHKNGDVYKVGLKQNWKGEPTKNSWVITGYKEDREADKFIHSSDFTKSETLPLNSKESIAQKAKNDEVLEAEFKEDFGVNFEGFKGKEAVLKLLSERKGQVKGAFYKEGLGDIDLVWGEITDLEKHKGYGLAHILDKRKSEFVEQGASESEAARKAAEFAKNEISNIMENGKIINKANEATRIETQDYRLILKQNWKGEPTKNKWLVTAYMKKEKGESISSTPFTKEDNLSLNSKESIAQNSLAVRKNTLPLNDEPLEAEVIEEVGLNEPMKFLEFQQRKLLTYIKENTPLRLLEHKSELKTRDILNYLEQSALNGKEKAFLMRNLERDLEKLEARLKEAVDDDFLKGYDEKIKQNIKSLELEDELVENPLPRGYEPQHHYISLAYLMANFAQNYKLLDFKNPTIKEQIKVLENALKKQNIAYEVLENEPVKIRYFKKEGGKRQEAKQKTINKVDEYAKSEEFKALSEDKQEAILSLKNLEPSIMPEGISTRDLAHLKEHFSDKFDKEQRDKFLKLFNDTKQNPHIVLEMFKNGELRKEYIKAYQHKESKDLYYIAISKDERDITGIPTTQIQKVINDIARSERVIKEAENLEGISNTAAPFKNETSPQRSNESIAQNEAYFTKSEREFIESKIKDEEFLKEFFTKANEFFKIFKRLENAYKEVIELSKNDDVDLKIFDEKLKNYRKLNEAAEKPRRDFVYYENLKITKAIRELLEKKFASILNKESEMFYKVVRAENILTKKIENKILENINALGVKDEKFKIKIKGEEKDLSLSKMMEKYVKNYEAIQNGEAKPQDKIILKALLKALKEEKIGYEVLENDPVKIRYFREENTNLNANSKANFEYETQEAKGIRALRAELKEALSPILNQELTNKETNIKAILSTKGLNKISSEKAVKKSMENGFSRDEHFKVASDLKNIFENSTKKEIHADTKGRENIAAVHRFTKKLKVNASEAEAKITLFENNEAGNRIYTLELESLEKPTSLSLNAPQIKTEVADLTQDVGGDANPTIIAKTDEESIAQKANSNFKKREKVLNKVLNLSENVESENEALKQAQKAWLEAFGLKSMEESYTPKFSKEVSEALESVLKGDEIRLTKGSFEKLLKRDREEFLPFIKETLESANAVIKQADGGLIFAKDYRNERLGKFFASVSKNHNGEWIIASNAPKTLNNLKNKIEEGGELLYSDLPELPIIAKPELTTEALNGEANLSDIIPQKTTREIINEAKESGKSVRETRKAVEKNKSLKDENLKRFHTQQEWDKFLENSTPQNLRAYLNAGGEMARNKKEAKKLLGENRFFDPFRENPLILGKTKLQTKDKKELEALKVKDKDGDEFYIEPLTSLQMPKQIAEYNYEDIKKIITYRIDTNNFLMREALNGLNAEHFTSLQKEAVEEFFKISQDYEKHLDFYLSLLDFLPAQKKEKILKEKQNYKLVQESLKKGDNSYKFIALRNERSHKTYTLLDTDFWIFFKRNSKQGEKNLKSIFIKGKTNAQREEDLYLFNSKREELESDLNITPLKEFGINYAEFYRDGKGAVEKLIKEAEAFKQNGEKGEFKGQVAGAFYREELGDIDLVWGDENFGLRHILEKHGGEFDNLAEQLSEIVTNGVLEKGEHRYFIKHDDYKGMIALDYKGKESNAWILTLYKDKSALNPAYQHQIKHNTNTSSATRANGEFENSNIKNANLQKHKGFLEAYEKADFKGKCELVKEDINGEIKALEKQKEEFKRIIQEKDYNDIELEQARKILNNAKEEVEGHYHIKYMQNGKEMGFFLSKKDYSRENTFKSKDEILHEIIQKTVYRDKIKNIEKTSDKLKKQIKIIDKYLKEYGDNEAGAISDDIIEKFKYYNFAKDTPKGGIIIGERRKGLYEQAQKVLNSRFLKMKRGAQKSSKDYNVTYDEARKLFYKGDMSEEQKELFESVLPIAQKLNVRIRTAIREPYEDMMYSTKEVSGLYRYSLNTATLKKGAGLSDTQKAQVLLHELIHSVTSRAMSLHKTPLRDKMLSKTQIKAIDEIEQIYKKLYKFRKTFKLQDENGAPLYGLTNMHEMLAELSNPMFSSKLKEIGLYEKLVNNIMKIILSVRDFIRLRSDKNVYEKLKQCLKDIIENYKDDFTQEYEKQNIRDFTLTSQTQKEQIYTQRQEIKNTLKAKINQAITNENTGEKAILTNKGISKMLSDKAITKSLDNGFSREEHLRAVEVVDELFKRAKKALSKIDEKDKNLSIYRYNAPFESANALMTLKEYKQNGKRIYSLELESLEAAKFNPSGKDLAEQLSKSKDADTTTFHTPIDNPDESITQKSEKLHSNPHLGAGVLGGSLNGVEQDEEGNLSFDPVKFVAGFLGASVGSKAVGVGFKHLEKNPALKEKIITELADTLAQGFDKAREKYPLLSLLEPRYIVQNERGRKIQAKVMLKNLLKLAEKESQKMKLKAYKTLKKYNVDHLEIAKEQEYRDFIANVWDKKNYEKAPNILKIAKLAPKLKKALGLEFDEVFLTKKDLSHFRTARKANYNQALSEAEMLEIPSVITHAKNAYIDTRHKNFFIIFADKKDNTKINFIHFNADELGNYIITTKKADRKVLNDKHYKQVGSGIEPHIP